MKISTKDAIYVQKKDLEFLKFQARALPSSINQKIFENSMLDLDDYDKYDFLMFENEEDIEFFKSLDWLIDYTEIKDLENDELRQIGENLVKRNDEVAKKLYSIEEKDESYKSTIQEYMLLSYQITTLSDISDMNNGMLKIKLPNTNDTNNIDNTKVNIPKLIKNILSKLSK